MKIVDLYFGLVNENKLSSAGEELRNTEFASYFDNRDEILKKIPNDLKMIAEDAFCTAETANEAIGFILGFAYAQRLQQDMKDEIYSYYPKEVITL